MSLGGRVTLDESKCNLVTVDDCTTLGTSISYLIAN